MTLTRRMTCTNFFRSISSATRRAPYRAILFPDFFCASSFPRIKASLDGYSPFELTAFRFFVASLVFAGVSPWINIRLPKKQDNLLIIALGVMQHRRSFTYGRTKAGRGDVFTHADAFFNLQQNLQQNEGERYWRIVADSD